MEKAGQKVIYYYKGFNCNYMEFVAYETWDKLMLTSGKGCRNTATIRKQGISKSNMNMISPSETLVFVCSPNKETFNILSEKLISCILHAY